MYYSKFVVVLLAFGGIADATRNIHARQRDKDDDDKSMCFETEHINALPVLTVSK